MKGGFMSAHNSLKDRRLYGKGEKKKSHPGQHHASLRKKRLVNPGSCKDFNLSEVKDDKREKQIRFR